MTFIYTYMCILLVRQTLCVCGFFVHIHEIGVNAADAYFI